MKSEIVTTLLVTALVLAAGVGYLTGSSNQRLTTSVSTTTMTNQQNTFTQTVISNRLLISTIISTVTSTAPASTVTTYNCGLSTAIMVVNGSAYCAMNVSRDIVVQNPGYSYFLNGSVSFMGVKFATICAPGYSGCPGSKPGNTTTVLAAAIRFNMTFPDKIVEVSGSVIGDSNYVVMTSNHVNPHAGMIIQYVSSGYRVFLLVSYFGG